MIVRVKRHREHPYVVLERGTLRMERLSFKARGLWAFCMTYPDDWEFHPQHLALGSDRDGITAVRSALKELVSVGLAYLERVRTESGTVHGSRWVIYETPVLNPHRDAENLHPGAHRDAGFPESGKPRNPVNSGSRKKPESGQPARIRSNEQKRSTELLRNKQQAKAARARVRGDGVHVVSECKDATVEAAPDEKSLREMLPAAASLKEEREETDELVAQLVTRGVDRVVAEKLVISSRRAHVSAMLRRGKMEAQGPGWYVRAVEEGYRSNEGTRSSRTKRYTHAEALAALKKRGYTLDAHHPLTKYFDVRKEDGGVYFVPTASFG